MTKDILAAAAPRPAPAACTTMAQVRLGVDALDRALVTLLAERQAYMDAAARIKTDRTAVHDQARIEDVIAKVKASARAVGLSEDIAEPVWRLLVDRSIAYEFAAWDRLRGGQVNDPLQLRKTPEIR